MIVAIVSALVVIAMCVASIVYLVRRGDKRVDQVLALSEIVSATREMLSDKTMVAERALFEKEKSDAALIGERERANALQEFISHDAQQSDPGVPLDPSDVDGRVLRIAETWRRANAATRGSLPAVPAAEVRPLASTEPT